MRKLLVLTTILSTLIINGCTQDNYFTIKSKNFTDEQNEVLALTSNRAAKYDLKNLPNDESYELSIVYEVYNGGEKVKEEIVFAMRYEDTEEKIEDTNISINIQDNKIILMSGGAYASLDIEENINNLSYYYLDQSTQININDEIYLFHGLENEDNRCTYMLSKEDLNRVLKENKKNVFIKLICKEI